MAMKSGLSGLFFIILLIRSESGLGSVVKKYYTHITRSYTWQDAQSYCRSRQTDLAIYTESDKDQMNMQSYCAWIGLHRPEAGNYSSRWRWSDGQYTLLIAWPRSVPDSRENCAVFCYSSKLLYHVNCGGYYFFMCHEVKGNNLHYTFVAQMKTWSEAQQHCRDEFDDLARFEKTSDLNAEATEMDFPVWIGLHRDVSSADGDTWKWSTGFSEYRQWAPNEPGDNGNCVSISSMSKEMAVQDCSARFPLICFKDNLILLKENKTWEEALQHCRSLGYKLVSVQPVDDHDHVMSRSMQADTEKVWTGLRFLASEWLWVNGADMLYSDLPLCPFKGQRCGALSKNGSLEIADCLEKLNFLCYST